MGPVLVVTPDVSQGRSSTLLTIHVSAIHQQCNLAHGRSVPGKFVTATSSYL